MSGFKYNKLGERMPRDVLLQAMEVPFRFVVVTGVMEDGTPVSTMCGTISAPELACLAKLAQFTFDEHLQPLLWPDGPLTDPDKHRKETP